MTVDGAYEIEKDFVILTCVRSTDEKDKGIGFLRDKKRNKVSLSRAQHGLIIVANL